jgi:hypothetical protein
MYGSICVNYFQTFSEKKNVKQFCIDMAGDFPLLNFADGNVI